MPSDDRSSDEVTPSTVLVLEPDILVRMSIADYLRDCGYKVIEGVTADDVLAVLESGQKIDIISAEAQLNLCKNNVDLLSGLQHGQYVVGCDALNYLVSAITQILCYAHPDKNVGLHEKNPAWCNFFRASII